VAAKLGRQLGVIAWHDQIPLVGCVGSAHSSSLAMASDGDEKQRSHPGLPIR
jgi:hypothetical protein